MGQTDGNASDVTDKAYTEVSRNIRGLAMHLDKVLARGDDVTALQETDVLESDLTWLQAKATAKGLIHSYLCSPYGYF